MPALLRRCAGLGALLTFLATVPAVAQSAHRTAFVGFGLAYGTAGIYANGQSDAKPGQSVFGRFGLLRNGRPFLVGDAELQLYRAPYPELEAEFRAVSFLGGVALFPSRNFYLLPQVGWQFRRWSGEEAPVDSDNGFLASLGLGYHLEFGPGFALLPEVGARFGPASDAGANSYRGAGFRVAALWSF
jgi:hypothetical protein